MVMCANLKYPVPPIPLQGAATRGAAFSRRALGLRISLRPLGIARKCLSLGFVVLQRRSLYDNPASLDAARRLLTNSIAIGSSDTATIPMMTKEKFFCTTGTLPNAYPPLTQIPTHRAAPSTL